MAKRAEKPETALCRAVVAFLQMKGCNAWRNNRGVSFGEYTRKRDGVKTKRCIRFGGAKGAADVFAVVPPRGRFLGVECKVEGKRTDRQRAAEQQAWRDGIAAAGGIAVVAYTLDDVQDALEQMI